MPEGAMHEAQGEHWHRQNAEETQDAQRETAVWNAVWTGESIHADKEEWKLEEGIHTFQFDSQTEEQVR